MTCGHVRSLGDWECPSPVGSATMVTTTMSCCALWSPIASHHPPEAPDGAVAALIFAIVTMMSTMVCRAIHPGGRRFQQVLPGACVSPKLPIHLAWTHRADPRRTQPSATSRTTECCPAEYSTEKFVSTLDNLVGNV